jgi:hypothetical protein
LYLRIVSAKHITTAIAFALSHTHNRPTPTHASSAPFLLPATHYFQPHQYSLPPTAACSTSRAGAFTHFWSSIVSTTATQKRDALLLLCIARHSLHFPRRSSVDHTHRSPLHTPPCIYKHHICIHAHTCILLFSSWPFMLPFSSRQSPFSSASQCLPLLVRHESKVMCLPQVLMSLALQTKHPTILIPALPLWSINYNAWLENLP